MKIVKGEAPDQRTRLDLIPAGSVVHTEDAYYLVTNIVDACLGVRRLAHLGTGAAFNVALITRLQVVDAELHVPDA